MLEERKVQKAKIALMRSPKFALLQGILMLGKTEVSDTTRTAKTNGRDEVYGRAFVKSLTDKELAFLIAHEASHKMYRHLTTWRKLYEENPKLANDACDYVINVMLVDLDPGETTIQMPRYKDGEHAGKPIGLLDRRFVGLNSKQVFDILKQEKKEKEKGREKGEGPVGPPGGSNDGEPGDDDQGGMDQHDWEGAKEMTEEEKKELARDIDQAVRQGLMAHEKMNGKGAAGMGRELGDLLEPKINWRDVLREYVKAVCRTKDKSSWRRVNRRFLSVGMYMPSMIGERAGRIVIGIDTSGSVGSKELNEFLSEVKSICEDVMPQAVEIIYWDGAVAAHEIYEDNDVANIVSSTKPRGGGGTSPSCVSRYLKEKNIEPECIVMLTDGYVGGDWGSNWTAPVLWCIVNGPDGIVADNGKTIHIKD